MGFFNESDDDAPSSRFIIGRAEEPPPLLIRKKEKARLNTITVAYSWVVDAFWSWAMTASMCIPTVGDGEGEFSILVELSGLGLANTGADFGGRESCILGDASKGGYHYIRLMFGL